MMLEAAEFLELPTLGRRLTASMVDAITLVAVYVGSIAITFQITGADYGLPAVLIFVGWLEFWFVVLLVIPTFRTGQTLGKRFTYLMCVDRATGDLCSAGQALIRYVGPMFAIPAASSRWARSSPCSSGFRTRWAATRCRWPTGSPRPRRHRSLQAQRAGRAA